jgi:dienelactone hydrolase
MLLASRGRLTLSYAVALAFFSIVRAAAAQVTFVADAGTHQMLGPKAASGAVIWSHGRSVEVEDCGAATPSYIEAFRRQDWDAFRLNRISTSDSLRSGSRSLAGLAAQLKAQGYRRVVLAGQSFGAFISLMAASLSDDIDAVIATAPAAFGRATENQELGALNASRLYPLLERVHRARVMLFYFYGDAFDPGGRGSRSEEVLSARRLPHLIVDRPAFFATHWAASTDGFAASFGRCIVAFAAADAAVGSLTCRRLERDQVASASAATGTAGGRLKPAQ